MNYLPIGLNIQNRPCLVIGGGEIACRKVIALLEAGGRVKVVSPHLCERLHNLLEQNLIEYLPSKYEAMFIDDIFLVVAATSDRSVNRTVGEDARLKGALFCDASEAETGDFIVPPAVRRGALVISVTTGGASPALARKIKNKLEQEYGPEYAPLLEILAEIRQHLQTSDIENELRTEILRKLIADETLLQLIRENRVEEARNRAFLCIS